MAEVNKPPTKSQIYTQIAEETGLSKKDVGLVFDSLTGMIEKQLSKGKKTDSKSFTIPGLCKIVTRYKEAIKAGTEYRDPSSGEMKKRAEGKPASQTVRIRPLKALKDMVT